MSKIYHLILFPGKKITKPSINFEQRIKLGALCKFGKLIIYYLWVQFEMFCLKSLLPS